MVLKNVSFLKKKKKKKNTERLKTINEILTLFCLVTLP